MRYNHYLCGMMDAQTKAFIREHAGHDLSRLLLSASRYPGIDVSFAVEQIAARRQVRDKLPLWYETEDLVFPSRLAAEQCSSEATAGYKQRLVGADNVVCDLTGGLGVDSFYLSRKARKVVYVERFAEYAEAARHNMRVLGAGNVEVMQGDSTSLLDTLPDPDLFYLDPARRGEGNKRLFALSDCEPDLLTLLPALFEKAPKVIAKISPMADIQQTSILLPQTTAIHVLSVRNECKELLFVLEREGRGEPLRVFCTDFTSDNQEQSFSFCPDDEKQLSCQSADGVAGYLYEPNASVMKAGAFKNIASQYELEKLAPHSHLYTSDIFLSDFPGRVFEVREVIPFQSKTIKILSARYPKANITARNFPLSVAELRQRTRIREGGDVYLFATTLADTSKVLIEGRKRK